LLAAEILIQAVKDWRMCRKATVRQRRGELWARQAGYPSLREELLVFFRSEWCEELFALMNLDRDRVMGSLGVPCRP